MTSASRIQPQPSTSVLSLHMFGYFLSPPQQAINNLNSDEARVNLFLNLKFKRRVCRDFLGKTRLHSSDLALVITA